MCEIAAAKRYTVPQGGVWAGFRRLRSAEQEVLVGAGLLIGDERGWLLVDFEDTQTNRDEMQALNRFGRAIERARRVNAQTNKTCRPTTRHCIRPT
jgi:hypothetical protein